MGHAVATGAKYPGGGTTEGPFDCTFGGEAVRPPYVVVVLAIIGAVTWLTLQPDGSPRPSEASNWTAPTKSAASDPYDQTGCSASKRAVSAKLRAPGTANWVSCRVTTAAGVNSVTLTVDSQNASGGLVRTEWTTKVRDNNVESVTQLR